MANETVARRYGLAIFQLASEAGVQDAVGDDLHGIAHAIYDDPATREFFLSPVVDRKEKAGVLSGAFSGKVHEVALNALLLLVRKRREALFAEIVRQYDVLSLQARGHEPLAITSAKPLTQDQRRLVVAKLESVYGKRFEVTETVDPSLIGGMRIMMGDRRIDGSVEGRMQELARTLFAKN